jgi:hypothetical protein
MIDDNKDEAWRRLCSQLEPLKVDPYSPQVPSDDSRYPQVQAILNEYKVATGEIIPVPPGWEGNPPLRPITTLADLDDFLMDQWDSSLAIEMGGEQYHTSAMEQAARAVRNGYRVLALLGMDERPERPFPAETLAVAKLQLGSLETWVRRKVKDGWTPREASKPKVAVVSLAKTEKRPKPGNDHEANSRLKQYLERTRWPNIRDAAKEVGLSTGKVSGLAEWREHIARQKAAKPQPKIKTIQMRRQILLGRGQQDKAIRKVMKADAIWNWLVNKAQPDQRAELYMATPNEKDKLIELAEEQFDEEHTEPDDD